MGIPLGQTPNPKFKTIALKSRINFFFQITTIAHVSRRVFSFLPCLVFWILKLGFILDFEL